jgi:hypothetical protein
VVSPQDHETERRALALQQDEVDRRFAEAVREWTRQAHPTEVRSLCDRFYRWVTEQGVNPAVRPGTRGWILGTRVEMETSFLLIVTNTGDVIERQADGSVPSTPLDLLQYSLGSVRDHIAALVAQAPGTWHV